MKRTLFLATAACTGVVAFFHSALSQNWTRTGAPTNRWVFVASSSDGSKLAALLSGEGGIYVSTNSGATWSLSGAPVTIGFNAVASSLDGSKLVAVGSGIYTSTNGGATWVSRTNLLNLESVASSADGVKLVTAAWGPGFVYTSTNSGVTWQKTSAPANYWTSVASSADGSKLAVGYGSLIYTSTDSGTTWNLKLTVTSSATAVSVASSADGNTLAWATGGGNSAGGIFVSTNAGTTWRTNLAPIAPLSSIACSADGKRLIALDGALIFNSTNAGVSWTTSSIPAVTMRSVASSADGSKQVGVMQFGGIYMTVPGLNVVLGGTNSVISWPSTAIAMGFSLQQNSDFTTTNWVTLTNTPALDLPSSQYQVSLPATNNAGFYRLFLH